MNVVILHNIISPHIETVFKELAKKVDLTVLYCAEREQNRNWSKKPTGFKFKILPYKSLAIQGKDLFTYFINPTIFSELSKINPDVVIISGWDQFAYQMAFLYCKIKNKKIIIWSGSTENEKSWRRTLGFSIAWMMVKGANGYIAYGTQAKKYLLSLGADPSKIFISFNTTNLEYYKKRSAFYKKNKFIEKKKLGLENKKIILYYGQFIERKGIDILIKAFVFLKKEIDNIALIIIGSGQLKQSLKELISSLNIKDAVILNDVGDKGICKFYAIADIFVLPSIEEVWGLVLNQAIVSGLPAIASDKVGGSDDLIKNGVNGFIFSAGDSISLYEAIKKLISSENLAKNFSEEGLKMIKDFYPQKTVIPIIKCINTFKN